MKLGNLGLPRPTAPNGVETQPAWRLPTPSCNIMTCYPMPKTPTRQALTEKYAAKCPPPAWGGAQLRGVGLAALPSRWVTGGPYLLKRLDKPPNLAPRGAELRIRAHRPLRNTPFGQNQAGSHALNCPPPAWRGAPSRGVEQMRCLNSHFRAFDVVVSQIATWHPSLPLQPRFQAWGSAQIRRGEGE